MPLDRGGAVLLQYRCVFISDVSQNIVRGGQILFYIGNLSITLSINRGEMHKDEKDTCGGGSAKGFC